MIYYRNGNWFISNTQISYKQNGITSESIVGQEGLSWWKELARKNENFEIVKVTPLEATTPLRLSRLELVNQRDIPEIYSEEVEEYVLDGNFSKRIDNPLQLIQQEEIKLKIEENYVQERFIKTLESIDIFPLLEGIIESGRYGSEIEMEEKINSFALSKEISSEEKKVLEHKLKERVTKDMREGVKPANSSLLTLSKQQKEINRLENILADLSELVLLEVL